MLKYNQIDKCLLCLEQHEIMISLDQTLRGSNGLSVAQMLHRLCFVNILDSGKIDRNICFMCAATIKSCYQLKANYDDREKAMEIPINGSIDLLIPLNNLKSDDRCENNQSFGVDMNENHCPPTRDIIIEIASDIKDIDLLQHLVSNEEESQQIPFKSNVLIKSEIDIPADVFPLKEEPNIQSPDNVDTIVQDKVAKKKAVKKKGSKKKGAKKTEDGKKSHVCDVCQKSFKKAHHLRNHKMIHTGEKPFVCDVCEKSFNKLGNLKKHRMIHTGEKPYECDICDRAFITSYSLYTHKMVHTGEKPHVCDVCGKAFSRMGDFNAHKLMHTGQKSHVCDVCNKSFFRLFDFNAHKMIHTGVKPFRCDTCGKAFTNGGNLKLHKRTHSREKLYLCDVCSKSFKHSKSLVKHNLTHAKAAPSSLTVK